MDGIRAVVLVEGSSDKIALEALATRCGRNLEADGVVVVAIGGAHAVGRYLERYGPHGAALELAGLCDVGEERVLCRALERAGLGRDLDRAGLEQLGFFVCEKDLEDELVRSLGAPAVESILAAHGKLESFRTYQKQPFHRGRPLEEQLCGFLTNWKVELAAALVGALDLDRVPRPLAGALARVVV